MSGSSRLKAGPAPRVQLPPVSSPDLTALASGARRTDVASSFSLGPPPMIETQKSHRRSIADYSSFRPQAIACSPPTLIPDGQSRQTTDAQFDGDFSSLGAIAGDNGIALFRASRPDAPLLVLSHSAMVGSGGISNLAFEPNMTSSVYLAAARGNGILIWDASGHSLSPLLGRLAVEPTSTETYPGHVRSVSWKPGASQPLIATTTSSDTCIWDLRASLGARTSKPSVRFGRTSNASPLIQVAYARNDECATMDAAGEVRVFDVRMAGPTKPRLLGNFSCFQSVGVGLSSFRTTNDESLWLTWGLDVPKADAVVKVWSLSKPKDSEKHAIESDTYWQTDGTTERTPMMVPNVDSSKLSTAATKVAQFTMPSLTCARVCPQPFENSIVTVGLATKYTPGKWKAELWKFVVDDDEASECTDTFGVDKILTFEEDRESFIKPSGDKLANSSLSGAELALCQTSAPISRTRRSGESSSEWELVLCCMKEDGYLTTSLVTEAPFSEIDSSSDGPLASSRSLRYFPNERRGKSTFDAATTYKRSRDSRQGSVRNLDDSSHGFPDLPVTPSSPEKQIRSVIVEDDSDRAARGANYGTTTQFELDVGVSKAQDQAPTLKPSAAIVDDVGEKMEITIPQTRSKPIGADRVPCPRLCGATFSSGIGGLICFNNGQTQKMWAWYKKDKSRRSSFGQRSTSEIKDESLYPRSKKDLDDMTNAAKDAQWGGTNNNEMEADENESEGSIEDLFDDLSSDEDGDLDSASDDDELPPMKDDGEASVKDDDLYQNYFGDMQKPVAQPRSSPDGSPSRAAVGEAVDALVLRNQTRQQQMATFDGPSSDVLAPVVLVSFDTDGSIFQRQNVHLAEHLLLGEWKICEEAEKVDGASGPETPVSVRSGTTYETIDACMQVSPPKIPRILAPPFAVSAQWNQGGLAHVNSDPTMHSDTNQTGGPIDLAPRVSRNDETVHGGEYAVRPGQEENMVLLRKIYHAPQNQLALLSPPDSHLLPGKSDSPIKRSASSNAIMQTVKNNMKAREAAREAAAQQSMQPIGVVTASVPANDGTVNGSFRNREKLQELCQHNAQVSQEYSQDEKANTWSVLAQAIASHVEDEADAFNGWGGATALGQELVKGLLEYHESQGDAQMVATIVCVLSTGPTTVSLLPPGQSDKYDLFIQRYAEMVYRWGLLTKRAELHKHLSRQLPIGNQVLFSAGSTEDDTTTAAGGMKLAFFCPRCGSETGSNNVCKNCRDYAFRCSLCANAVRGLFSVCNVCGHGGHINHIFDWFETNDTCPTGCGCKCVLSKPSETSAPAGGKELGEDSNDNELLALQSMQHYGKVS